MLIKNSLHAVTACGSDEAILHVSLLNEEAQNDKPGYRNDLAT